ncbi:MAG: hypothetical protein JRI68_33115 [Deltaproteobacteria bacterium]|nr:hypothetical protein [Deltaproteobacteria bacterium]
MIPFPRLTNVAQRSLHRHDLAVCRTGDKIDDHGPSSFQAGHPATAMAPTAQSLRSASC